jgi:hypothetical protein
MDNMSMLSKIINGGKNGLLLHVVVPVASVAVLTVGVVTGVMVANHMNAGQTQQTEAVGGVGLTVDPNASGYVAESTDPVEAAPGVTIPGWGSITIPPDTTDITVDFYNPESNEGYYYLTFELWLPDDSAEGHEVLYSSGLVEPGLHIQHITLSHSLSEGTYNAVVHVQPYKMDEDKTPTNNADMETELIVARK